MEPKMTSSSQTNHSGSGFQPLIPRNRGRRPLPRGFTLVELLVVMGIMLLLMGLALPMITRAYRNGVRARMQADLQTIAAGIDAYRADFKDIPRTDPNDSTWGGSNYKNHLRGAGMLCWALVAPGDAAHDGAAGPGFRVRTTSGQPYGPYINTDHIKIVGSGGDDHSYYLADAYGNPYLYYPANTGATITAAGSTTNGGGYVGSTSSNRKTPMFDTDDNDGLWTLPNTGFGFFMQVTGDTSTLELQRICVMLGETTGTGQIQGTETPKSTGPYILWGLGPDALGGPATPMSSNTQSITACDDVTNFTQ